MKSHIFSGLASLTLIFAIIPGSARPLEKYRQFQLDNLAVTLTLQRPDNLERGDWPEEAVQLSSQSTAVNGKTINELLLAANFFPDVEAFSLVYKLNPEISDLRNLRISTIRIPKVDGGAKLRAVFANGFQVLVTVERERKQEFGRDVQTLLRSVDTVSKFGPEKFSEPLTRDVLVKSLKHISEILDEIARQFRERYGRPVPKTVLCELLAETRLLNSIIGPKTLDKAKFDQNEKEKITEIELNLIQKSKSFKEVAAPGDPSPNWNSVEVTVKTVRDGQLIPNLRIWYIAKLSRDPETLGSFGMLSTDKPDALAKGNVYEADYCFWAAKDPSKELVTNEQCQELYLNRYIELTVK
ncbi:MAG TPA: hypothetical protein VNG71_22185 [Pyrinomonadaceae bacterium]|nr:hypothetical protein [Pyrinomonadaceae bacterium]